MSEITHRPPSARPSRRREFWGQPAEPPQTKKEDIAVQPAEVEEPHRLSYRYPCRVLVQVT